MKIKTYLATFRHSNDDSLYYYVDAPSKRIAKWCGANLYNSEYLAFVTAKDVEVKRIKVIGGMSDEIIYLA